MGSEQYRRDLERKRDQQRSADKKAGEFRSKESKKRAEADKARSSAAKTSSESTRRSRLRDAERREDEAAKAGREAASWQRKATTYAKDAASIEDRLRKAESSEAAAADRDRKREAQRQARKLAAQQQEIEQRVVATAENAVSNLLAVPRTAKTEKLRVLLLGSASEGDIRVNREQKRIRAAVDSALHRDQIELDVRPAATTTDLLDGVTRFRPHVVHFSGHSSTGTLVFEREVDAPHEGAAVTANAFASAVQATDDRPLLVILNSCDSAAQIEDLVATVVPFAIGMSASVADGDAITYATAFYAAVANGQSIAASHKSGRAALELAGLEGADLPTLAWATGVDPECVVLVQSP